MKTALAYFFVTLFAIQGVLFFRPVKMEVMSHENRMMASFPQKIRFTQNGVKDFFADLNLFFADRLFLRNEAIELAAILDDRLNDAPDFHMAYKGKDGWLFYGNMNSRSTDKLTGLLKPRQTSRAVHNITTGLAQYSDLPRYFILGSNKSSVYTEFLPDFIQPAPQRYSLPLLETIAAAGIKIYDPTQILTNSKSRGNLFFKTDTHWNALGGSVVAEGFIKLYNDDQSTDERINLPDYSLTPAPPFSGDLVEYGNFLFITPEAGDNFEFAWKEPRTDLTVIDFFGKESRIKANEMTPLPSSNHPYRVLNPQSLTSKRAWLFRDSFSTAPSPIINALFAETVHIYKDDLFKGSYHFRQYAKPDVIIYETVEREL